MPYTDPAKKKANAAKYYAENTEEIKAAVSEYRKENPEKKKESDAKWRAENSERIKAKKAQQYLANTEKIKIYGRGRNLKKFNMTQESFDLMLAAQNNRCTICEKEFTKTPHMDHDHKIKPVKVRGLLCRPCNTALGMLDDSKPILQSAINYLNKTSFNQLNLKVTTVFID